MIIDDAGNIYGTGSDGGIMKDCSSGYGPIGCGVIFKISPTKSGGWKEKVLYAFTGTPDGSEPGGLVLNKGKFYGAALHGGVRGSQGESFGLIFELSPGTNGWTETTYYSFTGADGGYPYSPLIFDKNGDLFGIADYGGTVGVGVVFEITP